MQKETETEIPQEHWTDDAVGRHAIPSRLADSLEIRVQTYNY